LDESNGFKWWYVLKQDLLAFTLVALVNKNYIGGGDERIAKGRD